MQSLLTSIEDASPYVCAYRCMAEVELEETLHAEEQGCQPKPVTMFFKRGHDQRRYNSPVQDEIAVVFVGEDGALPGFTNRDVVVHPRGRACERILILNANCDPMVSWQYRVKEGNSTQTSHYVYRHQKHIVFHVSRYITDLMFYVCRH